MEILNLLEERVNRLMREIEQVREENERILQDGGEQQAEVQKLKEENDSLKEQLAQEKQVKDDVLQRIDALLEVLKHLD